MRIVPGLAFVAVVFAGIAWQAAVVRDGDGGSHAALAVPGVDEVLSATLNLYPPRTSRPAPLAPDSPASRGTLAKLLGWLQQAPSAAGPTDSPARVLGHTPSLRLALRDGSAAMIDEALDCAGGNWGDGDVCTWNGHDILYERLGGDGPKRVRSPAFAAWLEGGWRQDIPLVPYP